MFVLVFFSIIWKSKFLIILFNSTLLTSTIFGFLGSYFIGKGIYSFRISMF